MSAFIQVRDYGHDIRVICPTCQLEQRYDLYKQANQAAKIHNSDKHPTAINWAD